MLIFDMYSEVGHSGVESVQIEISDIWLQLDIEIKFRSSSFVGAYKWTLPLTAPTIKAYQLTFSW